MTGLRRATTDVNVV